MTGGGPAGPLGEGAPIGLDPRGGAYPPTGHLQPTHKVPDGQDVRPDAGVDGAGRQGG